MFKLWKSFLCPLSKLEMKSREFEDLSVFFPLVVLG